MNLLCPAYHQESFDIESSTAQNNMAIDIELPEHKVTDTGY